MKQRLLAMSITLILTSGMIACGNDPTGPEAEIVGTWEFEDTDFVTVFANRFEEYLVSQGLSQTQARAFVETEFAGVEEDIRSTRLMVRFNADNTWEDDTGDAGTWRIDGDELVTTHAGGTVERAEYFLDGDNLTLIYTKALFLDLLRQNDDFDAEVYEMFNTILNAGDVFRIFYNRSS